VRVESRLPDSTGLLSFEGPGRQVRGFGFTDSSQPAPGNQEPFLRCPPIPCLCSFHTDTGATEASLEAGWLQGRSIQQPWAVASSRSGAEASLPWSVPISKSNSKRRACQSAREQAGPLGSGSETFFLQLPPRECLCPLCLLCNTGPFQNSHTLRLD
jgi:hypothetical protein